MTDTLKPVTQATVDALRVIYDRAQRDYLAVSNSHPTSWAATMQLRRADRAHKAWFEAVTELLERSTT